MKALITLGPTEEPIDEVRYISNRSSGKMGAAIAEKALERGYETTIIAGPVNIRLPGGAKTINVKTTEEMIRESLRELEKGYDVFICAAAIADYSPEKKRGKIKSGPANLTLKLKANPKLTGLVKEKFPHTLVVAFKAECNLTKEDLLAAAEKKLRSEKLDLVIANDIGRVGFGGDETEAYVVDAKANVYIPRDSKSNIADRIWVEVETRI